MKVIDLLNKIANNDLDTPDYIEYFDRETSKSNKMMVCEENIIYYMNRNALFLNDEVEIIEEPQPTKEEIEEYTNKFLEVWTPIKQQFGKLFDELIRIKNDLGLNLEDNIKEEPQEHKIPEKIDQWDRQWHYTYYKKEQLNQMQDNIEQLRQKYNKIVDYLEEIE